MKLMVMTLVVAMLLSMSAFAASVGYTSLVPTEINDGADYSITVNYSATGYNTGDQITLLVLTEDDEIIFDQDDATKPTNVAYIDQEAIEGETGSFTFTVAKSFITSNEVYVKLGATAQATAAAGTYTFTTSGGGEEGGDDEVTVTVNESISNAFGVSGLKIAKITDIPAGKVVTATGADVIYGTYAGATYCYILTTGDISASTVSVVDGTPSTVALGNTDMDENGNVNIYDATAVLDYMATPSLLDTNVKKFIADVDYNGAINIYDATAVLDVMTGVAPGAAQ